MRLTGRDGEHVTISDVRAENARATTAPGQLVAQARRLAEKAQELVDQAVIAERHRDTSWEEIGAALGGLSKSAAHKRYGKLVSEWGEQVDGVDVVDEDEGPQDLNSLFSIAYALVEQTWQEADSIVRAQDLLAELNNATLAVSGSHGTVSGAATASEGEHHCFDNRMPVGASPIYVLDACWGRADVMDSVPVQEAEGKQSPRRSPKFAYKAASRPAFDLAHVLVSHLYDAPGSAPYRKPLVESSLPSQRSGSKPSVEERLSAVEGQLAELLADRNKD
ncbi:hypothetical protein [Streptomyces sp. NPDC055060]